MARGGDIRKVTGVNVKVVVKDVLKELQNINDNVRLSSSNAVKAAAAGAVNVAQQKILETPHTQKYGDELVHEVGYKIKQGNKLGSRYEYQAFIMAPFRTNSTEMRRQMYYLEHGAGVRTDNPDAYWYYPTVHGIIDKNPNKVLSRRRDSSRHGIRKYGQKTLMSIKIHGKSTRYTDRHWLGFTNYSMPAHYMEDARFYVYWNLRPSVKKQISLAITRKSPYRLKENYYEEDGKTPYEVE